MEEQKQTNPKFIVIGFFVLAFVLFLIIAGPGDYMTGNAVAPLSLHVLFDKNDNTFEVNQPLSMQINFTIANSEKWPLDTVLELLATQSDNLVANSTITLKDFMMYTSNPPGFIDENGKQYFVTPGTYFGSAIPFNIRYPNICELNSCGIEFRIFVNGVQLNSNPLEMDVEVVEGDKYASQKGLPFIAFTLFSEMNELENAGQDLSKLTYEFKKGDNIGCFVQFNDGETIDAKIYGPSNTLDSPSYVLDNSSFKWDACTDDNNAVIPKCNIVVGSVKVKEKDLGEWSCLVNVCNSNGCTKETAGNTLKMIESVEAVNETLVEDCENGLDDDLDGFVDCSDTDCQSKASCNVQPPVSSDVQTSYGYQGYNTGEKTGYDDTAKTSFTGLKTGASSSTMIVMIIVSVLLGLLVIGFWLWMLVDAIMYKDFEDRIVWILVIIFLQVLGAIAYFFFIRGKRGTVVKETVVEEKPIVKEEIKPQDITPRVTTQVYDPLEGYVNNMIAKGFNMQQIKDACVKAGWDKVKVDKVCNVLNLKAFVKEQLAKGFSKERLKESLVAKGWKQDIIDEVFSRL